MMAKNVDLWMFIDHLSSRISAEREALQSDIGIELKLAESNNYFDIFEGGPLYLYADVTVEKLELRINKQSPHQRMLILSLSGQCVERSVVLGKHQGLQLGNHPRGGSADGETSWVKQLRWGKLSFGFSERNSDCLKTVVLNAMNAT